MSDRILGLVRLMFEDARALVWPLLIWFAMLVAYAAQFSPFQSDLFVLGELLMLVGPLVAGAFVQRHPLTRRAAWRTQPWSRSRVLTAKLGEIVLFVWLPAVALQLSLLAQHEIEEPKWALYLLELAIYPGALLLVGGALAVLCRSFLAFFGVFVTATLAWGWTKQLLAQHHGFADFRYRLIELVIFAVASIVCLVVAYGLASKRWGAVAFGLVGAFLVPAHGYAWNDWWSPAESDLQIVDFRGPERPADLQSWPAGEPVSLCVAFSVLGVPPGLDEPVAARFGIESRGLPHRLAEEVKGGTSGTGIFRMVAPDRIEIREQRFASMSIESARELVVRSFVLRLAFSFKHEFEIVAKEPLEAPKVIEGVSPQGTKYRYWITDVGIDPAEGIIIGYREKPYMRHLLWRPAPGTGLRIGNLPSGIDRSGGGVSGMGPAGRLAFGEAQGFRAEFSTIEVQRSTWRPRGSPEPPALEEVIDDLELHVVESLGPPGGETFVIWKNVTTAVCMLLFVPSFRLSATPAVPRWNMWTID